MPDTSRRVRVRYTGAPEQRAPFDRLVDLVQHTSLPEFVGSVEGDSVLVSVEISDPDKSDSRWQGKGRPDDLVDRFNDWLKKTYKIVPRVP